jgi:hypothetical protein
MLDTVLKLTNEASEIDIKNAIICTVVAIILGFVISIIYLISDKTHRTSPHMAISLVLLPGIVAIVIMLVGSNIARAFSMAGAFALVRFRSIPGDSKDIATVFYAMGIGLACGLGCISFAVIFTFIIGIVYLTITYFGYGKRRDEYETLRITIPEDLDYTGAFDDIFDKYSTSVRLERVKTTNLGSMFELTYTIRFKEDINEKEFIDDIRTRNGNLNIMLNKVQTPNEML